MTARRRMADLPLPQQAGILCADLGFQRFAAARLDLTVDQCSDSAAAEYLRRQCGITSRRELASNARAQARFHALRTEFDAWRGAIASPRDHETRQTPEPPLTPCTRP